MGNWRLRSIEERLVWKKIFEVILLRCFTKPMKDINPQFQVVLAKPKQDKYKEKYTYAMLIELLKLETKRNSEKQQKETKDALF